MSTDIELLRAYAERGSEAAFAELVRRHVDLVYSAALRRVGGDTHLAEDVSQKVFAALARQATALTDRTVLTGWLYTTARFAAVDIVRAERRRRAREQAVFVMHELSGNMAPDPAWEKLRPVLDEAMDRLNVRDREALLLRFFENRPLAEVGKKFAITEDAARKCVDRALERLRALLAKRGVGSTSAAIGLLLANQAVVAAPTSLATGVTASAMAAGVVAPSWAAAFHFMNASKIVAGLAGMALVVSIGVGLHEASAGGRVGEELKAAERNFDRLVATRRGLENSVSATESELARLKRAAEAARTANAVKPTAAFPSANADKSGAAWDPLVEGDAFVARHPEVRTALLAQKDARVDSRFSTLYTDLGWTPEQIAEFRALMRTTNLSIRTDSGQPLVLRVAPDFSSEEKTARLNALLGETGLRKMRELAAREPARDLANEVAAALAFTVGALTAEQAEALVQVIPVVAPRDKGKGREVDWDEVVSKVGAVLSPSQLVAVERLRRIYLSQRTMAQNPTPKGASDSGSEKTSP